MATPRCQLVDDAIPMFYHLVSRCVRRSWLCGWDSLTRRNYNHRKHWLIKRLRQLGSAFAVDVHAYAVMSNHFHLVVYYDPSAAQHWSDEEVVERWLIACPPDPRSDQADPEAVAALRRAWLADAQRLQHMRRHLGSLSAFMKQLKQPVARRANREDGCTGHFFEQRFYSGALLSEEAVLAAMAYVDLNPIRAQLAKSVRQIRQASITERLKELENSPERLHALLRPVIAGLRSASAPVVNITLAGYLERLEQVAFPPRPAHLTDTARRWVQRVATLKHRQRAFGSLDLIQQWIQQRGWQLREQPLP